MGLAPVPVMALVREYEVNNKLGNKGMSEVELNMGPRLPQTLVPCRRLHHSLFPRDVAAAPAASEEAHREGE